MAERISDETLVLIVSHRPALQDPGKAAIASEALRLRAAVSRVRELHHKNPEPLFGEDFCACCGKDWPCPTVRALDGDS